MRPLRMTRHRRNAEAMMIDRCQVTREDPGKPIDDITGGRPRIVVYDGCAKSQTYEAYEQNPESGGHTYTVQRYSAHFPWDAFVPEVGDVIEWTFCPLNPARVGTRERIAAPFDKTFHTALRVSVERMSN